MNTAAAAAPLGTVVWDATHPVPRRTVLADAAAALYAHYRRCLTGR